MIEADETFNVVGNCCICEKQVTFTGSHKDLRDTFACPSCKSIPRERALFKVLGQLYPGFLSLKIHESSPIHRGGSPRLRRECRNYSFSQLDTSIPAGSIHPEKLHRSEDLENLTFADDEFDVVITQDVFEHLFNPDKAAKEIVRILKPGGAHILTTPLTRQNKPSRRRCSLVDGEIVNLLPPIYHGNPMSESGSIVTVDWGYDLLSFLTHHTGTSAIMFVIDDFENGLRAPLMEVVVNNKIPTPAI